MEINPEYSLEGLMLTLHYFDQLMWRSNSLEKILILGNTEGKRRRGWQQMRWLDTIIDSMDMNLNKLQEIVKDRKSWCTTVQGITKSWTWLSDWTTTKTKIVNPLSRCHPHCLRWPTLSLQSVSFQINPLLTQCFVSHWILSAMRQESELH